MAAVALYAHRLGRAYGPDSSARALAGALAAGVDGLETDVCLTGDDELVLLHDPLLELGTTLSGWAHERPAREVAGSFLRDRNGPRGRAVERLRPGADLEQAERLGGQRELRFMGGTLPRL